MLLGPAQPIADVAKVPTGRFVNNTGRPVFVLSTHKRSRVSRRIKLLPGTTLILRDPDCTHTVEPTT